MAQAWHLCYGNALNREFKLSKPCKINRGHKDWTVLGNILTHSCNILVGNCKQTINSAALRVSFTVAFGSLAHKPRGGIVHDSDSLCLHLLNLLKYSVCLGCSPRDPFPNLPHPMVKHHSERKELQTHRGSEEPRQICIWGIAEFFKQTSGCAALPWHRKRQSCACGIW